MKKLFLAIAFLTRIPIPQSLINDNGSYDFKNLYHYFMPTGIVIGIIQIILLYLLLLFLPTDLAITGFLALSVLLTGAFHEDGFADVADSFGAFDRKKKLAIMRDSRLGTYGVSALILLFIARFSILTHIASDRSLLFLAIFITTVFSRWGAPFISLFIRYLNDESTSRKNLGSSLDRPNPIIISIQGLVLLIVFLIFLPKAFIIWLITTALLTLFLVLFFRKQFNGVTGDCLGASIVCYELTSLVTISTLN